MNSIPGSKSFEIITGPSGRAIAEPMGSDLQNALNEHLTIERMASAQYFAMSIWFSLRELRGYSSFFKKESLSEIEHANTFSDYLIARGQEVLLEDIPKPNQSWESIEDLISHSFHMETEVTTSLNQIYSMAERFSDMRTTVFLDPIIDGQVKSEDYFAYLLGKVKFAKNDSSSILLIDTELVNV